MGKIIADVSTYNGRCDWAKAKANGIAGGIVKIINRQLAKDDRFDENVKGLNANGMDWGVYNYTYANTPAKAKSDMTLVCDILDKMDRTHFTLGVWFDIEDKVQASLSKAVIADIINVAQATVEARGYTFGVYSGMSYVNEHIDQKAVNCKNWWIARYYRDTYEFSPGEYPYEKYMPKNVPDLVAWQYTSHGVIPGLNIGRKWVDLSEMYRLPGGKKEPVKQPVKKPVKEKKTSYPKVPFNITVRIPNLYVRKKPSTQSTTTGYTGTGSLIVTEVKGDWGKLKNDAGWCFIGNKNYVGIGKTVDVKDEHKNFRVKIDNLRIRKAGTVDAESVGYAKKGKVEITEIARGKIHPNGTTGDWGRLKSGEGWICLAFSAYVD